MTDTDRKTSSADAGGRRVTNSKVGRVIEEYELAGVGEELEQRWLAEEEQQSLRELAEWFNQQVLHEAMKNADEDPLEGEVENTYRLLTDDDVTKGTRTQTQKTLERNGIDVGSLEADFVSHQAVHTYLTKYRNVEYPAQEADEEDQISKIEETIQRLKNRTKAVTESTLERLARNGSLKLGTFEVSVDVRVTCEDCGTYVRIEELLAQGGCDCSE